MKYLSLILSVVFLVALGATGCAPREQKLYVVSLNDQHANIDYYPQFAALIDSLRGAHPDLLLFSAGDNRSGNPINDRYEQPSFPMYALMNKVGFDLSCLGNHEWDAGVGALKEAVSWADFPFVCANATFADTVEMPVSPYVVIEHQGLRIGVIGAIELGANGLPAFHPRNAGGTTFRPIKEVLPEYMFLRDECDALFLLSHCGYEADREIAVQFPQFDAIFGGHSHTRVADTQLVNGVMVTQAESRVKYVTLSTFVFVDGKVVDKKEELISVRDFSKRNTEVQAMVDNYNGDEFFAVAVGNNLAPINSRESLGCLMADAFRHTLGADLCFQNPGGVRYDTLSARPIILKDLLGLDPFDNEMIQFNLTGLEVIALMKSCYVTDHGSIPIFCSGCSYSYSTDADGKISDIAVALEDGNPLDMDAVYNVVMNSYMATVFDYEHEDEGRSTFRTSNELMLDYLSHHPDFDYSTVSRVTKR